LRSFRSSWLEALGDLVHYHMATAAMVTNNQLKGPALTTDAVSKAVAHMEPEKRLGKSSPWSLVFFHFSTTQYLSPPPPLVFDSSCAAFPTYGTCYLPPLLILPPLALSLSYPALPTYSQFVLFFFGGGLVLFFYNFIQT
jgi:hypothetical protein